MKGGKRMDVNYVLIGKRVRELRLQQQLSQEKLAEMIEMSVPYVSYIETGKKRPSLDALIRIANALGVTVDELLSGNQLHNPTEYQTDIDLLMDGCSANEKRLIFELISALTSAIRDNHWYISDDSNNPPQKI